MVMGLSCLVGACSGVGREHDDLLQTEEVDVKRAIPLQNRPFWCFTPYYLEPEIDGATVCSVMPVEFVFGRTSWRYDGLIIVIEAKC